MSNLKFPFKFKHVNQSHIFTAHLPDSDNIVSITWNEGGSEQSVTYTLSEVETYTRTGGSWRLIEEHPIMVEIEQDYYDELQATIENLEELVSEQVEQIRRLEAGYIYQQAACYIRLNDLLMEHSSFQKSDKC